MNKFRQITVLGIGAALGYALTEAYLKWFMKKLEEDFKHVFLHNKGEIRNLLLRSYGEHSTGHSNEEAAHEHPRQ